MDNPTTWRLFIALELPEPLGRLIEAEQRALEATHPPVKWVAAGGCHLTLQFLGEVETTRIDGLKAALREAGRGVAPFSIRLEGLGAFPSLRRPRVIWAGLEGELEPLARLQRRVIDATRPLGFQSETRPFQPHLTLGRVREGAARDAVARLGEAVGSRAFAPGEPWSVSTFALVRSELRPTGARYTVLEHFPLSV